jgi:hypothetical protein
MNDSLNAPWYPVYSFCPWRPLVRGADHYRAGRDSAASMNPLARRFHHTLRCIQRVQPGQHRGPAAVIEYSSADLKPIVKVFDENGNIFPGRQHPDIPSNIPLRETDLQQRPHRRKSTLPEVLGDKRSVVPPRLSAPTGATRLCGVRRIVDSEPNSGL